MVNIQTKLPSVHDSVLRSIEIAKKHLEKENFPKERIDSLLIVISELVNNAIVHGNGEDPNKTVKIELKINGKDFYLGVTDEGKGFDPGTLEDPTKDENLLSETGRGLLIASRFVDRIEFRKLDKGWMVEVFDGNKG